MHSGCHRQAYLTEVNRPPTDDRFFKKMECDPTDEFSALITDSVDEKFNKDNRMNDNVFENPCLTNCTPVQFYRLPKIQKEGIPGLPIVSDIGNPTEKYLNL